MLSKKKPREKQRLRQHCLMRSAKFSNVSVKLRPRSWKETIFTKPETSLMPS